MAHAYTPGLKVLQETKVAKERRLPLKGEVIVKKGDTVAPEDIVATTDLPGNVQMINVANLLNLDPGDVLDVMIKKSGESVGKGEMMAETKGFFGLFKANVKAPVDGTIESISTITGQVVLREAPIPVEVDAYVTGIVKDIFPEEGVKIETDAVFIQGIFGIGGESRGDIQLITSSRDEEITADMITPEMKGKIVVGGSFISLDAYQEALKQGLAGVVVGGFNYHDLEAILGYTLGVAITGSEDLITSLIVTEGYGKIKMGSRTFDLLKEHDGKFASINGATQIRAGVIRPEIVIPLTPDQITGRHKKIDASEGISAGTLVRVIRAPYFGRMGVVQGLPAELRKMESETMVRVAEVEVDGEILTIPRSNLEMIETN
ncbi:MAG: hypothetical protein GWO85_00165 [Simkaniaceae bacterium]|nr:hypothetical protein [Simkaniaceae bacterium]